jgi:hypothetical protein
MHSWSKKKKKVQQAGRQAGRQEGSALPKKMIMCMQLLGPLLLFFPRIISCGAAVKAAFSRSRKRI